MGMRDFRNKFVYICLWLSLIGQLAIHVDAFVARSIRGRCFLCGEAANKLSLSAKSERRDTEDGSEKGTEDWTSGGRVAVTVRKTVSFPSGYFQRSDSGDESSSSNPLEEASECLRNAWIEFHWKKGGGLPIVILENDKATAGGRTTNEGKTRVIAPVMMEETISSYPPTLGDSSTVSLEYKVTSPGPFFGPDLVLGSHIGTVDFSSEYSSANDDGEYDDSMGSSSITTTLVWKVEFDAIRLLGLYQKVTEFTIGTAATTVCEAAKPPRLLTLYTKLEAKNENVARSEWLDFLFSSTGGGLPLPPPIPFGDVLEEGRGRARKKLFRFPPGLVETAMVEKPLGIDETVSATNTESDDVVTAYYRLENPGWWTFPFLVHTHLGRAQFLPASPNSVEIPEGSLVDLIWEVEIRPYSLAAPIVELLTEMTISTIARNLRVKLEDPEGVVNIQPPRGGSGQTILGSIPRATWIGRVLEAHLSDKRSTWRQTLSLLQPWTWGNSVDDQVTFEWSDGGLQSSTSAKKSLNTVLSIPRGGETTESTSLANLCGLVGADPCDLLHLRVNEQGVRGIYASSNFQNNQILLRVPLEACLRDDQPPKWLSSKDDSNKDPTGETFVSVEPWVTTLAANLLDLRFFQASSDATKQWLNLLPKNLREVLPIYWKEEWLKKCGSQQLCMAVDAAQHARSNLVDTILESLPKSDSSKCHISRSDVEEAVDLVQTRSVRAESSTNQNIRLLVPIVDMINHDPEPNARFVLQDGYVLVLATQNIAANSEVLIDYGASTRPAWRCLFSYGFVPNGDDIYETDLAEIPLEPGDRVMEVGPTELPSELVYYEASRLKKIGPDGAFEFDASIGQSIVDRLVSKAQTLASEIGDEDDETVVYKLIRDLKESNRRTLLVCAGGLREFLEEGLEE